MMRSLDQPGPGSLETITTTGARQLFPDALYCSTTNDITTSEFTCRDMNPKDGISEPILVLASVVRVEWIQTERIRASEHPSKE